MSIEKGIKWVKDGEVVEVFGKAMNSYNAIVFTEPCVWFKDKHENMHVLTERDFLKQYKPYDPVYEWEFVAQQPDGVRHFTHFMTQKEMEYFSFQNDCAYYQRLDFTKRERR